LAELRWFWSITIRDRARVGQHGDPPRLREKFMQDFESFYIQL
jgi:hypothetical protein